MALGKQYGMTFTEIFERCQTEMNDKSTGVEQKWKDRVNQIYTSDLPNEFDWPYLNKETTLTIKARYNTGTVSIDTSGNVTGASTVWTSDNSNGLLMKVDGTDEVMTFTFSTATTGTVSPVPITAISGKSYELYQPVYELPSDFDRLRKLEDGSSWYYYANRRRVLQELMDDADWNDLVLLFSHPLPRYCRIKPDLSSSGLKQIEIGYPPQDGMYMHIPYHRAMPKLMEITDTAKTGSTTTKMLTTNNLYGKISVGQYIRVDADKQWVRITAIATDTTAGDGITIETLETAGDNTDPITVSDVPDMPAEFHDTLFLGACARAAKSQGDKMHRDWKNEYDVQVARLARKYSLLKKSKKYRSPWGPQYERGNFPYNSLRGMS